MILITKTLWPFRYFKFRLPLLRIQRVELGANQAYLSCSMQPCPKPPFLFYQSGRYLKAVFYCCRQTSPLKCHPEALLPEGREGAWMASGFLL